MKPVQVVYKNKMMTPTDVDPELAKDAMAHALLPGYLYRKQLYCLQEEGTKKVIPETCLVQKTVFPQRSNLIAEQITGRIKPARIIWMTFPIFLLNFLFGKPLLSNTALTGSTHHAHFNC